MNFSNLAQTDMLAQLLIEKRMLTRREFLQRLGNLAQMLNPMRQ